LGELFRLRGNLSTVPLGFQAELDLAKVNAEEVIDFVRQKKEKILEGKVNIELKLDGKGTTYENISKTLNGNGNFAFVDGEIHSQSLTALAQKQFDEKVSTLSVVKAADDIFQAAEKALANPLVQNTMGKNFDLVKYRRDYDTIKNLKIAEKVPQSRSLKDAKGSFEINEGRISLATKRSTGEGELDFKGSIGLDSSLQGHASFAASSSLKQKMIQQTPYASLLFDKSGGLVLPMQLGGSVTAPTVASDLSRLQTQFSQNARTLVEREVKQKVEAEIQKALKGNADKALKELEGKAKEELKRAAGKAAGEEGKKALEGLFKKKK
jgi:AsmA protein